MAAMAAMAAALRAWAEAAARAEEAAGAALAASAPLLGSLAALAAQMRAARRLPWDATPLGAFPELRERLWQKQRGAAEALLEQLGGRREELRAVRDAVGSAASAVLRVCEERGPAGLRLCEERSPADPRLCEERVPAEERDPCGERLCGERDPCGERGPADPRLCEERSPAEERDPCGERGPADPRLFEERGPADPQLPAVLRRGPRCPSLADVLEGLQDVERCYRRLYLESKLLLQRLSLDSLADVEALPQSWERILERYRDNDVVKDTLLKVSLFVENHREVSCSPGS